jgi:hypothetical protein
VFPASVRKEAKRNNDLEKISSVAIRCVAYVGWNRNKRSGSCPAQVRFKVTLQCLSERDGDAVAKESLISLHHGCLTSELEVSTCRNARE